MSVSIRLRRTGTVKKAHWRIVASHRLTKKEGKFIEHLGFYDPGHDPAKIEIKTDRLAYWLGCGAIPSSGVKNLMKQKGIKHPQKSKS